MNLKAMIEKRNALMDEMDGLFQACEGEEQRAFHEEEAARFSELEAEIRALDATIAAAEKREKLERRDAGEPEGDLEQRALDDQHFLDFCRGESRALDIANNGAVIPAHIAGRIIETVKELSPIYGMCTVYNVGGDLIFPVYDEAASSIKASYVEDLTELTEGTGKFASVKLENFIVGCLAKISKSLMNRTDFDLLSFVVRKVAQAIAEFLERELVLGTAGKMTGVTGTANGITAAAAAAVTADELIDLQMVVPEVYQGNAVWLMHKDTLRAIRKLKDGDGNYLLNRDMSAGFGWSLLGKRVYITESMPKMAAGKKAVVYGDLSGLYVKLSQNVELQILMEKYATQHAVGVVGYVECDSDIVEPQKLAALTMKAGA